MKKFKIVIALMLALLMSFSLLACDMETEVIDASNSNKAASTADTKAPASSNTEVPDSTTPEQNEPPLVDQTLEDAAKASFKDITNMTAVSKVNIDMLMNIQGQSVPATNYMQTTSMINGSNCITQQTQTQNMMGDTTVTNSDVTQIGNDFYTYTNTADGAAYMIIDAEDSDLAEAEEMLGVVEAGDVMYSINHFNVVDKKENADGSVTYTCTGLRPSAAALYQERFAAAAGMLGVDSSFNIQKDTMKYVVTFKDGRFASAAIDMTVNAVLDIGGESVSVVYTYDIDETYTYGDVAAITVPTAAGYNTAARYTWDEFWQLVSGAI